MLLTKYFNIYNNKLIRPLILLISLINTPSVYGQIFSSEQNPPSIKWRQLNLPSFQIIYPHQLENEAQRMANTLQSIITNVSSSLKIHPKKISIILQNQGTTANGFVQLAPRRSELFTTPPQEFDYQDWLNSLAIHELRHVVQFDKLTGKLKAPLFEELAFTIFGVTLPPWFYEGDAVGIETALTSAGRGRQPEWNIIFRTNTLSNKNYSYSKNYFGSLNDFTPGYYQLGFFMTTKLRKDYGENVLNNIYTRLSANPLRPYNLTSSIKNLTGLSTKNLHDSTVNELENLWENQLNHLGQKEYPAINKRKNTTPENYLLPSPTESGNVIILKESKAKTPRIVLINKQGKEKTLITIGSQEEPHFNYANGSVVWDEFRFDPRYQKRSFNVINWFNIATKQYKQITHKTRLFAPALSPDASLVIAVEVDYKNKITLVELDVATGRELKRYQSPHNYMLQTPRFDQSGQHVVMTGVSKQGKTLLELDRNNRSFQQLIPFQQQLISRPEYAENDIVFKAHYNGIDNLYRLNKKSKEIYQITNASFGAFNPDYDTKTKRLFFNNYSVYGQDISYILFNPEKHLLIDSTKKSFVNYIEPISIQEGNKNVFDSIPENTYPSKPYKEFNNLFYFHSLMPIIEENPFNDNNYGFKLQSDNKLNTLSLYAGYQFNNALKKSEYISGFTYLRYFPILDVRYKNGARLNYRRIMQNGKTELSPYTWRENALDADITVPLIFNKLNHTYQSGIKFGTSYTSRYSLQNTPSTFVKTLKFPAKYQVYFNHNNRRSARDLAPAFGQNITLSYQHFPFENALKGMLLTFESLVFFPGFAVNHTIQASFNYQNRSGDYRSSIDIPLVSGYNNLKPRGNLRNTLLLDYRFPLFYPDWEIGPLAYIKRFKGGFFADFENIAGGNKFEPLTYGAELRADMNLLRFYLPNFDLGGKIIFVNEKPQQNPIFEAIVSYNF